MAYECENNSTVYLFDFVHSRSEGIHLFRQKGLPKKRREPTSQIEVFDRPQKGQRLLEESVRTLGMKRTRPRRKMRKRRRKRGR